MKILLSTYCHFLFLILLISQTGRKKNIITKRALKRMLRCITSLEHRVTKKAIEIDSSIKEIHTENEEVTITHKKKKIFKKI